MSSYLWAATHQGLCEFESLWELSWEAVTNTDRVDDAS